MNNPLPTRDEIKAWKRGTAAKFKRPIGEVHAIWLPYLLKQELIPPGGRPRKIDLDCVYQWRQERPPVKWVVIGVRLNRDPDVVKSSYHRWRKQT